MEKTFTFKLSADEADQIVKSLGEQPYKSVARLIANLQMQFQQQQQNSENLKNSPIETEQAS